AQEFWSQRTADRGSVAILMGGRERCCMPAHQNVIVFPEIGGANVASEIEFVQRAVKIVRAALGHHLHLAARSAVEIRRLSGGADLELLDTFDGSRHHAGWSTSRGAAAGIAVARSIRRVGSGHVVAVISTIELELVLIGLRARDVSIKRNA